MIYYTCILTLNVEFGCNLAPDVAPHHGRGRQERSTRPNTHFPIASRVRQMSSTPPPCSFQDHHYERISGMQQQSYQNVRMYVIDSLNKGEVREACPRPDLTWPGGQTGQENQASIRPPSFPSRLLSPTSGINETIEAAASNCA